MTLLATDIKPGLRVRDNIEKDAHNTIYVFVTAEDDNDDCSDCGLASDILLVPAPDNFTPDVQAFCLDCIDLDTLDIV